MKKLVIIIMAVVAFTTVGAYGQMLSQGTKELDIQGSFDNKGAAGSQFWIGLGFGYFVVDNLECQVAGAFINNDYQTGYHPAIGINYNIDLGSKLVPFFGVDLGWGIWDNKDNENLNGFVYGVQVGVKYFLVDNIALSCAVNADWSTDDLWTEKDGKMVNNDLTCHWGLRYYF